MNRSSFVLWATPSPGKIAARVAIAGDFLPAGELSLPDLTGWRQMARSLAPHFDGVSASFVNIECVIDASGLVPRTLFGLGDIVSAPSACLDYIEAIRGSVVGIANNHSYDFGAEGVARTREAILQRGIVALGAGLGLRSATEVAVWQGPQEIRVGFWAAARATSDPATRHSTGVEPATVARGLRALQNMSQQGACLRIALLHAGCLRTNYPDPEDLQLMDRLAQMGFDIVAASHSHRISGSKMLRRENGGQSFCFYGLGSLVSGYVACPAEREGLIVVAGLDSEGTLVQIEIRTVLLSESGFGEMPSQAMSQTILDRFLRISGEIEDGSYERAFYRDMSNGLLQLYVRDASRAFHHFGMRGLARKVSRVRMRHVRRLVHKVMG